MYQQTHQRLRSTCSGEYNVVVELFLVVLRLLITEVQGRQFNIAKKIIWQLKNKQSLADWIIDNLQSNNEIIGKK